MWMDFVLAKFVECMGNNITEWILLYKFINSHSFSDSLCNLRQTKTELMKRFTRLEAQGFIALHHWMAWYWIDHLPAVNCTCTTRPGGTVLQYRIFPPKSTLLGCSIMLEWMIRQNYIRMFIQLQIQFGVYFWEKKKTAKHNCSTFSHLNRQNIIWTILSIMFSVCSDLELTNNFIP